MRAPADPLAQRVDHGPEHDLVGVPVQPGRVLAEQVDVLVPVDILQRRVPRPGDPQREWPVVEDRPGIAAWQESLRPVVQRRGQRPAAGEALPRLRDRLGHPVRMRLRHGRTSPAG